MQCIQNNDLLQGIIISRGFHDEITRKEKIQSSMILISKQEILTRVFVRVRNLSYSYSRSLEAEHILFHRKFSC